MTVDKVYLAKKDLVYFILSYFAMPSRFTIDLIGITHEGNLEHPLAKSQWC